MYCSIQRCNLNLFYAGLDMDFLINALNKIEDDLNSTIASVQQVSVHTVEDLNPAVTANKLNKNQAGGHS